MYSSAIRLTKVSADIIGKLDSVILFGIPIPSYDVASFDRFLNVSDDMIDRGLSTCVGSQWFLASSFVVLVAVVLVDPLLTFSGCSAVVT